MQVFYSDYSVDEGLPLQEGRMSYAFSALANKILLW